MANYCKVKIMTSLKNKNVMKPRNLLLHILVITVLSTSCEKMLETGSDRLVLPGSHQLNSPSDTLYSMIGIFTKLEKLAEPYVLLGELRGDLMDVADDAGLYLKEIYNFDISTDNPYNNIRDYYSVINNCNYLIQNIDTSIVANAKKIMYKEFAAAKAIRAWTYLQIVLNYGKAYYYTKPALTVQDASSYKEYTLSELLPVLIQDLEPWGDIDLPGGISLGVDVNSDKLFFPLRFVLGDLYLWNGNYEKAALEYYNLIVANKYVVSEENQSTWTVENGEFVNRDLENQLWLDMIELGSNDYITIFASALEEEETSPLVDLSLVKKHIFPSKRALSYWDQQEYVERSTVTIYGDLRGDIGSYFSSQFLYGVQTGNNIISKYLFMTSSDSRGVSVYRKTLLYLRYAEALNRAGKPNAAFAVLKYGMNSVNIANDNKIPPYEKYKNNVLLEYLVFDDVVFSSNIGIHALGCGNIDLSDNYIINPQSSPKESILYVENKILEELALETAFEGNRFHDLMRIALRRNDPSFLADMVSEKYGANKELIWNKLNDVNNWYLP